MIYRFKIVNGVFVYENEKQAEGISQLLASFNNTGKYLEIEINEYSRATTPKQYKLFNVIVAELSKASGMTHSEAKKELYDKFSPDKIVIDFAKRQHLYKMSVEDMNQRQYQDFLENCVQFMKEFFEVEIQI